MHGKDILKRDRARAMNMMRNIDPHGPARLQKMGGQKMRSSSHGVDVTDAGVTYTASVGVGSPATDYTLLIDTGKLRTAIRWSIY